MMDRLFTAGIASKRIRRFQHIVNVFAKYGFGEALTRIRVWESVTFERRITGHEHKNSELSTPERLRLALEDLGPTFVKLGQVLSTRPDLLPPEYIFELKKLQTSAHFIPVDIIKKTIESELGSPIDKIFESFEDSPLAAASLAQVHRAVFKSKQVVLKVQRPGIAEITEIDISIMHRLATLAERYSPSLFLVNAVGLVDEFATQIKKELDFRMEANNSRRFKLNFENDETIYVPEIYPEMSTKRVITMEYLAGINISDIEGLRAQGSDLSQIAERGAILGFTAVFQHGFFHADPHPGNIIVLPGNIIGLVDFGMMATLSLRDRERLAKLILFISIRDEKRVARALNELMESEGVITAEELEPAMVAIIIEYGDGNLNDYRLAAMLFAMMRAVMALGARLRPQLMWVTKSIAIQEDIAHSLNARFNIMELGKPYAQKVLKERINPILQPNGLNYWVMDALDLVRDVPYDISVILREFRKGRIKIEFEHVGLEPIRLTMERVANRILLTLLIAALLISSSVIVLAGVPPMVSNIPILGFIGYVVAGILSLMLAVSIWFRNR